MSLWILTISCVHQSFIEDNAAKNINLDNSFEWMDLNFSFLLGSSLSFILRNSP
jgi:hypothetical protein